MKTFHAVAAIAILAGGVGVVAGAIGADAPDRPEGVALSDWAPITDTLGLVLVQRPLGPAEFLPDPAGSKGKATLGGALGGAILSPPENGYFMVKHAGRWVRLVVIEPLKGPGSAG